LENRQVWLNGDRMTNGRGEFGKVTCGSKFALPRRNAIISVRNTVLFSFISGIAGVAAAIGLRVATL
ncbi:hypothetical protein ABTN13_20305, partial [Acinetobacter baumannii]